MGCLICMDDDVLLRELPCCCGQSMCIDCINRLEKSQNSKYTCPFCQKEFECPEGGFEELPLGAAHDTPVNDTEVRLSPQTEGEIKLRIAIQKGRGFLMVAEQKIERCSLSQVDVRNKQELIEEKIESLQDETNPDTATRINLKKEALEQACDRKLDELERRLASLKSALVRNTELVREMESYACDISKHSKPKRKIAKMIQRLEEGLSAADKLLSTSEAAGLKPGDSVRLNINSENLQHEFLSTELTHNSVGYIHQIDVNDNKCEVIFAECSNWKGETAQLVLADTNHHLPMHLENVRVKPQVQDPYYGWQEIQPESIGVLVEFTQESVDHRRVVKVDFPNNHEWLCLLEEIEKDTTLPKPLKKGDIVCIRSEVLLTKPGFSRHGSGKIINADKAGKAVVNFTDGKRWKGPITQIEIAEPITVGDRVRVKKPTESFFTETLSSITVQPSSDHFVSEVRNDRTHGKLAVLQQIDIMQPLNWTCPVNWLELLEKGCKVHQVLQGTYGMQGGVYITGEQRQMAYNAAADYEDFVMWLTDMFQMSHLDYVAVSEEEEMDD